MLVMKKKVKVCLLFGGKSGEHEVSLQSAKSIYEALDKEKYDVTLVGIDKGGRWLLPASAEAMAGGGDGSRYLLNAENPKLIKLNREGASEVTAVAKNSETQLISLDSGRDVAPVDVFFPITHGTFGEDGSLQGFLELLDAAYVGAGVLGSAVGMDKDVMKRLLRGVGLPVAKFVAVKRDRLSSSFLNNAVGKLGFPIFVKPANLGSSVGISKVKNEEELDAAIEDAFQYDTKVILEEYVPGREIECSVLGNDDPIGSVPGEIIPNHEFYSYEAKYIDEDGAALEIPAKLAEEECARVRKLAVRVFKALDCSGMARVDFFLRPDGEFVVNEINTLPGFTNISMYPKLWEATGVSYSELLDRLIELALERKAEKDQLRRKYSL